MKTRIIFIACIAALAAASCTKAPDYVTREESRVTFDCLAQTAEQNIRARGDWNIDLNGAEWIRVSPEEGTGDGVHYQMYTISVDYNKGGSREHTIYVCQGDVRCPVTVHQNRCKFGLTGVEVADSLFQFKESATGISVKYDYAAGDETVALRAELSGAAAAGLSVAPQTTSDFSPGSGALFLPITGTPTVQGKFDVTVYADDENVQYVYIMEIDRVPQELTEDKIYASLEKHLAEVNPSYGDKVKNGLIKPLKILFSLPETYVLYKEMMLMKGNAIAQLKPVTVIGNELQKRFFFRLVDDFEEIKAMSAHR